MRYRAAVSHSSSDRASSRAFRDEMRAFGDEFHRGGHFLERHDDGAGQLTKDRPHGAQHGLAAGTVDE